MARGDHLSALQRDGLRLLTPGSDETLPVPAVAEPDDVELDGDDVLVLATKSQHTAEALGTWSPREVIRGENAGRAAGEVLPVLCAQNGVANEPAALRWFARVAGVCVWLPTSVPEPGTVLAPCAPLTGMLHLGAYPSSVPGTGTWLDDTLDVVAADLEGALFRAPRPPEAMACKRAKLVSNLGNAFDATGRSRCRDGGSASLRPSTRRCSTSPSGRCGPASRPGASRWTPCAHWSDALREASDHVTRRVHPVQLVMANRTG